MPFAHPAFPIESVRRTLAVVLAAGLGVACGTDPPRFEGRPGDSLLVHADRLRVWSFGRQSIPADVLPLARRTFRRDNFSIDRDRWTRGEVLPLTESQQRLLGGREELPRWRAHTLFRLDLGVGTTWLRHQGRALRPVSRTVGKGAGSQFESRVWRDGELGMLFWWDADAGMLVAAGEEAPGIVECGWDLAPGTAAERVIRLSGLDRAADAAEPGRPRTGPPEAPTPESATELACRATFGSVDRAALLAPAPTVLTTTLEGLDADALDVSIGVLDLAFDVPWARLHRATGLGDGVTFTVDVVVDGSTERIWSRTLGPGQGWIDARLDLSAWRGQTIELRLATDPGPDGEPAFDWGVWSGLRLRRSGASAPARPHVVLLDIDTLRADRLGLYGSARDTSPALDAWAAERTAVYTDAVSTNDWTLPATVSMLTGLEVSEHGVLAYPQAMGEALGPLAERLADAGYETRAHTDGGFLTPAFGFAHGFEVFDFAMERTFDREQEALADELAWLAARDSSHPVFLFLHTYVVHAPYDVDRRFLDPDRTAAAALLTGPTYNPPLTSDDPEVAHLADVLYDAGVRRADELAGAFLAGLEDALDGQPALVIVTSDHGEALGERHLFGHGRSLYREVLSIPLMIRFPGGRPAGRDGSPVSLLDVAPTILAAAGLDVDDLPGHPLQGGVPADRVRVAQHGSSAHAVLAQGFKYLRGGIGVGAEARELDELYDQRADPRELRDLSSDREQVARLARLLDEHLAAHPSRWPEGSAGASIDDAVLADLTALGYVGDLR